MVFSRAEGIGEGARPDRAMLAILELVRVLSGFINPNLIYDIDCFGEGWILNSGSFNRLF